MYTKFRDPRENINTISKISYKIFVTLIAALSAIFILSCADNSTTSTKVIFTPTKVFFPTKTPFPTPIPQVSVGTVLAPILNIRNGPGTENAVLGSMKLGDEFYILFDWFDTANRTWFKIPMSKDSFGWIIGEAHLVNRKWINIDSSRNRTIIDLYGVSMYTLILDYAKPKNNVDNPRPSSLATNPQTIPQSIPPTTDLLCKDTSNMVGKTVKCKITRAYCSYQPTTSGKPTYCNDAQYPGHKFTLLIWGSDWSDLDGLCIMVSGQVYTYNGKPQIEATNRSQVTYCN